MLNHWKLKLINLLYSHGLISDETLKSWGYE